jgi:hypothetical protein
MGRARVWFSQGVLGALPIFLVLLLDRYQLNIAIFIQDEKRCECILLMKMWRDAWLQVVHGCYVRGLRRCCADVAWGCVELRGLRSRAGVAW